MVEAAQLTWIVETVDASANVGTYTSIALDSMGYPHISYYDEYYQNLKYARWTGSDWIIEPVDTPGEVGEYSSIALDSYDHPHISYYDRTHKALKYAKWTLAEAWFIYTVDSPVSGENIGKFSSIAVDSNDWPHISYTSSRIDTHLKYATWDGSLTWEIEVVEEGSGHIGRWSSIALDSADRPHISYEYSSLSFHHLKYATLLGPSWETETVDSSAEVGAFSSIAVDSLDRPHISYWCFYSATETTLKYATLSGTSWNIVTVDSSQQVGEYTSIALDFMGHPHISYYDSAFGDLKYAWWDSTHWFTGTVDSVGDIGRFTSIALDSTNHPHIVYRDQTEGNLKYAQDPDESFRPIDISTFDSDSDGYDDAVTMIIDADTTYSGSLVITVNISLINQVEVDVSSYSVSWGITGSNDDAQTIILATTLDWAYGWYDLEITLYDDMQMLEDYQYLSNAVELYPLDYTPPSLTIQVEGSGTTFPDPGSTVYAEGSIVLVDASPDEGWIFDHWLLDDVNAGSESPIEVTMDTSHTLVAVFIASSGDDQPLEIEVSGSGTTQPAPGMHTYPQDSDVVVTALPESGWQLDYWLLDSVEVGSQANITVTMDSDHAVVAVFTPIDDSVDDQPPIAEAGDDQSVAKNTDVTFDATSSSDNIGIVEYHWDFGDGTTDTGVTCTHRYTTAGSYTVTLTVIDAAEHSDVDTLQVTVSSDESIPGFELWMLIPVIGIVLGGMALAFRRRSS
jgi:PKD repeat protein